MAHARCTKRLRRTALEPAPGRRSILDLVRILAGSVGTAQTGAATDILEDTLTVFVVFAPAGIETHTARTKLW